MNAAAERGPAENVAVVLTPPGPAAIAVVRLGGPLNADFAARHLSRPPKLLRCVHCDFVADAETIDDVIVVALENGTLDLNLHGGPWVMQAALNAMKAAGYRVVPWASVPDIAFETADKIERQTLLDLPRARSRPVLRMLAAQPAAWRAMLAAADPLALRRALEDTTLERALSLPTVAIVGPPNVGKSTLANALFAQERSITADRPGTTRDWVGELAVLGGLVVRLVDTPGLRETGDAIEAAAIARSRPVIAAADCVVIVTDGSRPAEAHHEPIAESIGNLHRVFVRTKADLPRRDGGTADALVVSAVSGVGMDALRAALRAALGVADFDPRIARCWTAGQRYQVAALLESVQASI